MRAFLVAVAVLVLVGCSTSERGLATIRTIGPTGDSVGRAPQPIWKFAITNGGNAHVVWHSAVEDKGGGEEYSHAGGHIDWPQGVLGPGEGVVTHMIVPAAEGSEWRGYVEYWPISLESLKKAQADLAKLGDAAAEFESVVTFCPHPMDTKRTYYDGWRR